MDGIIGVADGIVVDGNTEGLKAGGLKVRVDVLVLRVANMDAAGGMVAGTLMVLAHVGDLPL